MHYSSGELLHPSTLQAALMATPSCHVEKMVTKVNFDEHEPQPRYT
jgi:hypothetical protein